MNLEVPIPPKVVIVVTPVAAEKTTQVESVSFGSGGLIIAMSSEHWGATIAFRQSYGFRVLDELDLTEFWSQCSLAQGWLFKVISGGWKDLEMTREHFYFGRHDWVSEYLIVGFNECVSVLSKEEPAFEVQVPSNLLLEPTTADKSADAAQLRRWVFEFNALKSFALLAITTYQRYVSPHKGFCCAYRIYTGHRSCSALGYRAIRMYGLWPGVAVLRRRFDRCATAFRRQTESLLSRRAQQGFCDIGCPCDIPSCDLPCDMPSIDCGHEVSDALNCCSNSPSDCGNWGRSRRNSDEEKYVYIPPQKWPNERPRQSASPTEV